MRVNKRVLIRFLSVLLCFSLVLPLGFFSTVQAKADQGVHTSVHEKSQKPAKEKIADRLQKQFKEKKTVTFLLKFQEQVDTQKVAKDAAKKAQKLKQTAAQTTLAKRSSVVSALRGTANETQQDVKAFLDKQKKAGHVTSYESYYIVNAIAVTGSQEVMEQLASFPEVAKVLPNELRQLHPAERVKAKAETAVKGTAKAKDGKAKQDSNLSDIEWNIDRVGAPAAWQMGIDGTGTVVANIDTGVDWEHPTLKEKYRGYDEANPDNPSHDFNWFDATAGRTTPYDDDGHGTHTMGTMVGAEPNGANQIGVAPGAKWIAVKAFTPAGGYDTDLLAAGEWILAPKDAQGNPRPDMAPDVVNNSWGGGSGIDEWYRDMVRAWRSADIFPEFSAGNTRPGSPGGPGSVANPANYPESFATGATDINDQLASFSLQGPSPYGELKPEVSAPGVNIRSAIPGNGYGNYNGTSMSGPHTSAVVALLRQANASLTVDEIEQILQDTATPLTDSTFPESPNNGYGYGLVNAFDAVSSVMDGLGRVQGQVVQEGEDNEPPTFEHDSVSTTYEGMDLPLVVTARDNVSVTSVQLQYRSNSGDDWVTVDAKRISGDFRDGVYQATIPGEDISGSSLHYRWKITDFGNNEVTSDVYDVNVSPGITIGYSEDFESYPVGWVSYGENDSWEWGVPTSGPGSAFSGENVYATNLSGMYDNNSQATLMMPPVDLPEGPAYLQYKHWYNLENNWDFGYVRVSTDMENWTTLETYTNISNDWVDGEVDLSDYAGQRVYLSFHLATDFSVTRDGWYIDQVALTNTSLNKESKARLGVEPKQSDKADKNDPAAATGKADKNSAATPAEKKGKPAVAKQGAPKNVKAPAASKQNGKKPDKGKNKGKNKDKKDKDNGKQPAALPVAAKVSVLESGRQVNTNPADGSYSLTHATGTYTMQAEAYGFRSAVQTVEVPRDGEVTANFTLDPIPQGTITGTVTDKSTGEPVANATLYVVEDAAVQPVSTDENGAYSLTAYEGTYTLVVSAPNYYRTEVEVTVSGNDDTTKDITLKPFIGYPGEIGYDSGEPDNARAFYDAGNGWAVKMSLAEGKERALLTAGVFRFWDTEWPIPGGTEFQVAVYDASGDKGAPGKKLAGPIDATAKRDGSWTVVDLSDKGIMVEGDFYIVYIQTKEHPNAPGLATDESGQWSGRSWQLVGGAWSQSPRDEGNYMIRARVNYEVETPTITSPTDGSFTNDATITVEGQATADTNVHIMNNGEEVATATATKDGKFSTDVELQVGENSLTAAASTENGRTEASEPVVVTLDQTKPEVTIDSPKDGSKTNRETVTVEGKAIDDHLDWVKVNGQKAKVNDDGSFAQRILLDNGKNEIKVVAQDKAGNKTTKKVTVHAKYEVPVIDNLEPTEDKHLKAGETVKIAFDSEPGLKATFTIRMPLVNERAKLTGVTELPMMEMGDGHYVGYWTATSNAFAKGAEIEVKVVDDYKNEARKTAVGKLFINVE